MWDELWGAPVGRPGPHQPGLCPATGTPQGQAYGGQSWAVTAPVRRSLPSGLLLEVPEVIQSLGCVGARVSKADIVSLPSCRDSNIINDIPLLMPLIQNVFFAPCKDVFGSYLLDLGRRTSRRSWPWALCPGPCGCCGAAPERLRAGRGAPAN